MAFSAVREGGRYIYLWIAIVLYSVFTEALTAYAPDIDNFWHAQATVMLMGQRLPLYIICVYLSYLYTAVVTAERMGLPWWAQPFAAGIGCLLFDLPLDVMTTKLLFWTWHDTDPNLADRHFYMPWANFNYFLVSGSAFYTIFFGSHKMLASSVSVKEATGILKELIYMLMTSLLTFPLFILLFTVYYDALKMNFNIHGEECVLSLAAVYGTIIWIANSDNSRNVSKSISKESRSTEVFIVIVVHYCYLVLMAILSEPENVRSTGYHEPVGPCNETTTFNSISTGKVLTKRTYLCLTNYDEPYDFHCVQNKPNLGDRWYTICGTAHSNRAEYVLLTCIAGLLGIAWHWKILRNSEKASRPLQKQADKVKRS